MNRRTAMLGLMAAAVLAGAGAALATPSTEFWTPANTDVQPFGVPHLGLDVYSTAFKSMDAGGGSFPADLGLTIGVLPFETVQMEVGVDLFEPTDRPFSFNAKLGVPERALFRESPAVNVGMCNLGTQKDVTDQNVGYVLVGKTIPVLGRLHLGPYIGNGSALVNGQGERDNVGFMIGYDRGFFPARDAGGNAYHKLVVAADYATGDNAIGGGGVGLGYYFYQDISLLFGPVWFNDREVNGEMKWPVQLGVNLPSPARIFQAERMDT